jgi:hypothetical protein
VLAVSLRNQDFVIANLCDGNGKDTYNDTLHLVTELVWYTS